MFQFTIGPALVSGRMHPEFLLKVPFIHAVWIALAIGATGVAVPGWIANTAALAGGLTIPLMLLALGVSLARLHARSLPRAFALSAVRVGGGLAVGFAVAALFGLEGAERGVLVIQSAMPTAVFTWLFAKLYDNAPEEIAGIVLISTVVSYLSLPVVVAAVM